MKQLIIARKDLDMSPGKLAAQVSHASMAFLTNRIRSSGQRGLKESIRRMPSQDIYHPDGPMRYKRADLSEWARQTYENGQAFFYVRPTEDADDDYGLELCEPEYEYSATLCFDPETWNDWINGAFTKVVCEAKNKIHLMKAVQHAEELGLHGGTDYFLIKDSCYTELTPEEVDEEGVGRTLTCIGFKPLPDELCLKISRKYQLYH